MTLFEQELFYLIHSNLDLAPYPMPLWSEVYITWQSRSVTKKVYNWKKMDRLLIFFYY